MGANAVARNIPARPYSACSRSPSRSALIVPVSEVYRRTREQKTKRLYMKACGRGWHTWQAR